MFSPFELYGPGDCWPCLSSQLLTNRSIGFHLNVFVGWMCVASCSSSSSFSMNESRYPIDIVWVPAAVIRLWVGINIASQQLLYLNYDLHYDLQVVTAYLHGIPPQSIPLHLYGRISRRNTPPRLNQWKKNTAATLTIGRTPQWLVKAHWETPPGMWG